MVKQDLESKFKSEFLDKLRYFYPGCFVMKNDANALQGIPDTTVFYGDRWIVLEFKRETNARRQPNQKWYINTLNSMSYATFVYPENEEEVLHAIQHTFSSARFSRPS